MSKTPSGRNPISLSQTMPHTPDTLKEQLITLLSWPHGVIDTTEYAMQTCGDLRKFLRCIEACSNSNQNSIAEKIQKMLSDCSQDQILRSIDLTVRLWLNLHVRSDEYPAGPSLSGMTEIQWHEGIPLQDIIKEAFPSSSFVVLEHESLIDPSFTVENLHRLCRIKIRWTANLKDHLRLDRSSSTLHIFPHKICLLSHLASCDILPKDLVSETLKSLDLLFPFSKESTLEHNGQDFLRISSPNPSGTVYLGDFRYWQKRLKQLHDVYNQAPKSFLQMWYDRRNPVQWWTFRLAGIIAVLTLVFGVIASYTGFQQVALAEKTYQLSILQACSQIDPPEFC